MILCHAVSFWDQGVTGNETSLLLTSLAVGHGCALEVTWTVGHKGRAWGGWSHKRRSTHSLTSVTLWAVGEPQWQPTASYLLPFWQEPTWNASANITIYTTCEMSQSHSQTIAVGTRPHLCSILTPQYCVYLYAALCLSKVAMCLVCFSAVLNSPRSSTLSNETSSRHWHKSWRDKKWEH